MIDISKILEARGINAENIKVKSITIETKDGEKITITNPSASKTSFLGLSILIVIEGEGSKSND